LVFGEKRALFETREYLPYLTLPYLILCSLLRGRTKDTS
jgi:hypothetical protein